MQITCLAYLLHSINVSCYFIKALASDYTKQLCIAAHYRNYTFWHQWQRYCTAFWFILLGLTPSPPPHIVCFTTLLDLMSLKHVVKGSFGFCSSCLVNVSTVSRRGINSRTKHKSNSCLGSLSCKVVKWNKCLVHFTLKWQENKWPISH